MSDTPRCDFCSSRKPTWRYPARDLAADTPPVRGVVLTLQSKGDWAACQRCHELIEAGDRDGLAERSARSQKAKLRYPLLLKLCRSMHDAFWAHREGAPVEHRWPDD